jgi:tungstate transport system substrate-binding protein
LFLVTALAAVAQQTFITIASTTSTEESGLFDYLLPAFAKEINIQVRVVAVGTGQALKIGERGDCQSLGPENAGPERKELTSIALSTVVPQGV